MQKKVCGEFPNFCYRVYECEEYARQFIQNGIFRMYCRFFYKSIEDKSRCDPDEGRGCTLEPGIITCLGVSPNPEEKPIVERKFGYQKNTQDLGNAIFYFCTCLPEVNFDYTKERFGRYIVKIGNPRKFAEDINDYFLDKGQNFRIEGHNVIYNKGQKLRSKLTDNERIDLSYKQKPENFSSDCEFRIVAIKYEICDPECKLLDSDGKHTPKCEHIEINLGKKLNYLSLVKCD